MDITVVRVLIEINNIKRFNGTAFFIDGQTLVTAKHVVLDRNDKKYENIFLDNTPDGGKILISKMILCDMDLAILKVKKSFDIKEVSFTEIVEGKDVTIKGFDDDNSSLNTYKNRISGYVGTEHIYKLQNSLTKGLSGSPVLFDNKICGVAISINRNKNLTYFIPISELCKEGFFDNQNMKSNSLIQKILEKSKKIIEDNKSPEFYKKIAKYIRFTIVNPWVGIPLNLLMLCYGLYSSVPVINKKVNNFLDSNESIINNQKIKSNMIDLKGIVIENNENNISIGGVNVFLKGNEDKHFLTKENNGTFIIKNIDDGNEIILCYEHKDYRENYCLPYKREGKNNVKLPK